MVNIKRKADAQFPSLLHLTYDLQQLSDKNLLVKVGIGLGQARILSGLNGSVPQSQKELALNLHQTEANISRQLQILKKQKLVTIAKNKKDSRQRDVKLTPKGAQKYKTAVKLLQTQQAGLAKLIGARELKAFEKSTQNMVAGLGAGLKRHRKLLS